MRFSETAIAGKPTSDEARELSIELQHAPNEDPSTQKLIRNIENGRALLLDNIVEKSRRAEDVIDTTWIGLDLDDEDWTIDETKQTLKEHCVSYHILYKTASYLPHWQKHRVLIKLDKPVEPEDALKIYSYLATLLPLDKQTVNNLGRIWFGTFHKIDDRPEEVMSTTELLSHEVVQEQKVYVYKNDGSAEVSYFISNINTERFQELVTEQFSNWDYDIIRKGVYSASIIHILQTGDYDLWDVFFESLDKIYRQQYINYMKHDLEHKLVYYHEALDVLREVSIIVPADVKEVFDILKDTTKRKLKPKEFIQPEMIAEIETGYNLLVAPAGTGKSTALISRALQDDTRYRVLIVPTIAIAQQLDEKYGDNEDIRFLYSTGERNVIKEYDDSEVSLTICTYDAYFVNTWDDHILYIDEAHELIGFHSMMGKRKIINYILTHKPENTLFVTASPLNLADVFDKKVIYTRDTNKNTTIVSAESVASGVVELIGRHWGQKTLVYVNSKSKIRTIVEKINESYPDLVVDSISSADRNQAYDELLSKASLTADVVLVTKFLNIGFDINSVFSVVIYGNNKLLPNDVLQFFNRERQSAKFYCVVKEGTKHNGIAVNTSFIRYKSKLNRTLSRNDKQLLDSTYTSDDTNEPHLIVNYNSYRYCTLGLEALTQLFEYFYGNFEYESERSLVTDVTFSTEKVKVQFDAIFYHTLDNGFTQFENLLTAFLLGEDVDWTFVPNGNLHLSDKTVTTLMIIFATIRRNLLYYMKNPTFMNIEDDGIEVVYKNADYWFYISDTYVIDKLDSDVFRKALTELHTSDNKILYEDEVEAWCTRFNARKLYIENKPWTDARFIAFCRKFRIWITRAKIKGEDSYIYENVTQSIQQ